MELTWQSIITAGGVLSALMFLLTTYNRVYRWTLRQKEQDEELKAIRKENTLLTYGVLACLKGMAEQGCNGPVREAIDKIEKSLNLRAHELILHRLRGHYHLFLHQENPGPEK